LVEARQDSVAGYAVQHAGDETDDIVLLLGDVLLFVEAKPGCHGRSDPEIGIARGPDDPAGLLASAYLDIYPRSLRDQEFLDAVRPVPLRPVAYAAPGEVPPFATDPADSPR
jgi:hypothetical protein